jgi:geranylgeranyl diphosphate synthase type II
MPVDVNELKSYIADCGKRVDTALDACLPRPNRRPATIHKAMRHSVFAGGKRLRPVLCLAATEACGGDSENALPAACAVEMLHTYSLVHDDLPCMDDDDLRRGRPTCHKVFGEGMAVLCGDALLTAAFAVLARIRPTPRYRAGDFVGELAEAGGSRKLIGGQVMDLEGEGQKIDKARLVRIHEAKTAALLTASLRLGAMSANATPAKLDAVTRFGHALGLAFQVIDDILDVTQSSETLGKTAGKDAATDKATYPAILGLDASRREAARLTRSAMRALEPLRGKAMRLRQIAEYLLVREY